MGKGGSFFLFFLQFLKQYYLGSINKIISSCSVEYKLHEASLATPKEKVETYHRIAEALKFGNMLKPLMSDPAFSEAQVSWHGA